MDRRIYLRAVAPTIHPHLLPIQSRDRGPVGLGGALEKWPKFKNALMVLRTGNKLVMVFVMMCMNFERKKLSGRSSYSG